MKQEIPKPLRKALARQAVGDVHPSPDVLTSFQERTLAPVESESVTHHLAECAQCREIVFLASNAAEDEVRDGRELVAAGGNRAATIPVYAASSQAAASRSRWSVGTRWAVLTVAAMVLVSVGLVLQYWRGSSGYRTTAVRLASNRPAPATPQARQTVQPPNSQEAVPKPAVPETLAKAAPRPSAAVGEKKVAAPTGVPAQTEVSGQTTIARKAADQFPSAPVASAPPPSAQTAAKARSSEETALVSGVMNSAMVPEVSPQSSFVKSESVQKSEAAQPPQLQQRSPALFGKSGIGGMYAVSAVRPQWRIGPSGHLERSLAANQWTQVLDDQPVTFHAVAVIANDVWAGGNGGALFHSSDRGEHWSKVSLATNSTIETGAIVSIRFDDAQHGSVSSDSGARWATTDGGVTWTNQ